MRKSDALNPWTFIRAKCPELCTLHSTRLFPDDKLFVNILLFLHEKLHFEKGASLDYMEFLRELSFYVSSKTGFVYPHVSRLFQEERTSNVQGYKNIIEGLLNIRLGCVISNGVILDVKFSCVPVA